MEIVCVEFLNEEVGRAGVELHRRGSGETDDYCYNIAKDHVHDLHATMMHLLGVEHTKLTFKYQGRHFRLTDVHGEVVERILS